MLLVVDSSIWVKGLIPTERDHVLAHQFFRDVATGRHQVISPTTVFTEVICGAGRQLKQAGIDRRLALKWGDRLLRLSNVSWKTVDRAFAYESATTGWLHGLRGMDAIIAATAILYGCPLLTHDQEFHRLAGAVVLLRLSDVAGE